MQASQLCTWSTTCSISIEQEILEHQLDDEPRGRMAQLSAPVTHVDLCTAYEDFAPH